MPPTMLPKAKNLQAIDCAYSFHREHPFAIIPQMFAKREATRCSKADSVVYVRFA